MEKKYIQAKMQIVDKKIEFVASDETIDRMGDSLKINDWDLSKFKKNPVLLVNHDYRVENIVGKAKNIRRDLKKKQLIFEAVFHDLTEKAQSVRKMVEEKFLNTVSVGFIPKMDEKGKSMSLELLEISFVPIPANPSAQQLSVKAFEKVKDQIKEEDQKMIEEFVKKEEVKKETKQALPKEVKPPVSRPKENSRAVAKVGMDLRMLQKVAKYVNDLLYEARRKR